MYILIKNLLIEQSVKLCIFFSQYRHGLYYYKNMYNHWKKE